MALAHISAGYLSDRIGRRPILIAAWGIGVAATLIMAFATDLIVFIGGALLYGFTAFVISPLAGYLYTRDPALMYPVGLVLIGFGLGISLVLIPRLQRS